MKRFILLITLLIIVMVAGVAAVSASDGFINGGGHVLEAPEGLKRPYWLDISFGGWAQKLDVGTVSGEWQINFHNVGVDAFDQSSFHTTDIRQINFYPPSSGSCQAALNFTAFGSWNGNPGYKLIFRAGDFSTPNSEYADTIRVELYNDLGTLVYDTHWSGEFSDQSTCVGTARTGLDNGNLTIIWPSP